MSNRYSVSELFKNAYALVLTKVFYPGARLIRRPFYLRGRRGLCCGKGLTTGYGCRFETDGTPGVLHIGCDARIGDHVHIYAAKSVTIGDNVLIASKVFISDTSHGWYAGEDQSDPATNPSERKLVSVPVSIGDNVWLGDNVVVLPGAVIGDGCVVGANAVVKGQFGPNRILVGAPARAVKEYNPETKKWEKLS